MLGWLPNAKAEAPAIILLQRTHFSVDVAQTLVQDLLEQVKPIESNDIVHRPPVKHVYY